ncbi:PH domain-containing protein [Microbacterium sp. NPDC057407]|uniref:PH domain-containing protein n=1 Tax=Microbacterium sp. NPDC057407 TaxID=3346120 RepID=UPI0036727214
MSFQEVHYRPVFGRTLAVVTMVVCALGAAAMAVTDPASAIRYVWPILLVGVLAWALFWRPSLLVQEHGITVENVLRTHFVPWPSITAIDTRYSVTLHTTERRVQVWAAPASGRHRTLGLAPKDFDGVGESARGELGELRPGDAITTPTGNLAQLIRGRWEQLRDSGAFASGVDPDASTQTWHVATIATVAALSAATVIGIFV